jgi:hypothetical protein
MRNVETAGGGNMTVEIAGDLRVDALGAKEGSVSLGEALVPTGLQENLLSVGAFCDQHEGNEVKFDADGCVFFSDGDEVLAATRDRGAATYQTTLEVPQSYYSALQATTRAQKRQEKGNAPKDKVIITRRSQRQRTRERKKKRDSVDGAKQVTWADKQAGTSLSEGPADDHDEGESVSKEKVEAAAQPEHDSGAEEAMLLHQRHDHLNLQELRRMVKAGKEKVSNECRDWFKGKTKFACEHCAFGKNTKKPLKRKNAKQMSKSKKARLKKLRRKKVKEIKMGMDLSGPFARGVGSYPGVKYALLLRAKKTRYSWLRFLKQKSAANVFKTLSGLLPLVKSTLRKNRRLVILTDLGSEWVSEKVENLFESLGIEHRYTARDSSLRNGVCERHFRTLEQGVVTARRQSGLSEGYWPDLMETTHEVRLHLPTQSLGGATPYEQQFAKDSSSFRENLQPVGCLASGRRVQRTSLGLRGQELVYLGPRVGTKDGMRLLNLKTRQIQVDRSVVCVPTVFPCLLPKAQRQLARQAVLEQFDALGMLEEEVTAATGDPQEGDLVGDELEDLEQVAPTMPWWEKKAMNQEKNDDPWEKASLQLQRDHRERSAWEEEIEEEDEEPRPRRVRGKPNTFQPTLEDQTRRYIAMLKKGVQGTPKAFLSRARAFVAASSLLQPDPVRWQEAMEQKHWREAWKKEEKTLWAKDAFVWEMAPPGAKIIGSQIVWKTKRDEHNNVEQFKARGVARGDQQVHGDTYTETFAPTVRMDTVRLLFTLAASKGWNMRQADVNAAFLIPRLPEDVVIYMRPFPTMRPPPGKEGCVLRLRSSLYGIKQAPMLWNQEICNFLEAQGYVVSSDPCLYIKKGETGKVESAVLFHVDDLLCTGKDESMEIFMKALKAKYAIKDFGEPKQFLGIAVNKTKRGYTWSQEAYLERLLEKFAMSKARLKKTPIVERLYKLEGAKAANATKYRELVGGLMYLMTCTRPDLCFAVNQLCRHFQEPQEHHWRAALRALAYLKNTKSHGLVFEEEKKSVIKAYTRGVRELTNEEAQELKITNPFKAWSDADWAGDKTDRKSTTGYLLQLGTCLISFRCQKQAITATSSTTAELIALALATKEVLWQKKLFRELFDVDAGTVPIMEDNQGAKILAETNKFSHKTKHLPNRYFFCREKVKSKEITVDKVSTKDQLADIFTKALGPQVFLPMRDKIGVVDLLRHQHISA